MTCKNCTPRPNHKIKVDRNIKCIECGKDMHAYVDEKLSKPQTKISEWQRRNTKLQELEDQMDRDAFEFGKAYSNLTQSTNAYIKELKGV